MILLQLSIDRRGQPRELQDPFLLDEPIWVGCPQTSRLDHSVVGCIDCNGRAYPNVPALSINTAMWRHASNPQIVT